MLFYLFAAGYVATREISAIRKALPFLLCLGFFVSSLMEFTWFLPKFIFHPLIIEFGLGILAYRLIAKKRFNRWISILSLVSGVVWMLSLGMFCASQYQIYAGTVDNIDLAWVRLVSWGIPSFLIVYGLASLECISSIPEFRVGRFLGNISYSLYLTHGVVFSFAPLLVMVSQKFGIILPPLPTFIFILILPFVLSHYSYVFLECKLTSAARKHINNKWIQRHFKEAKSDFLPQSSK